VRGQASIEYIAAVALLACVLAGAGVAVAAPGLPGAVVRELRLALCIVGGDVCRAQDAAARGLEPCLIAGEEHERETGISFLFIRGSGSRFWSIERLSDGRIRLTAGNGQGLDATAGIGVHVGPVSAGGSASGGVGFRTGRTWILEDEDELQRVLSIGKGYDLTSPLVTIALPEPDVTFLEGGGSGAADLAIEAVKSFPGAGAEARGVLGRSTGDGGTTYYVDLGAETAGPLADAVPGIDLHGRVVAEYLAADPPVITLRASGRQGPGEEVETVMRLPLRTDADRDAARRVAFLALADPAVAIGDLVARIRARGTVERFAYRSVTESGGWDYGLDIVAELGADRSTSTVRRELVEAQVLNGPLPASREDCLQSASASP
jgi:hypothetical protein